MARRHGCPVCGRMTQSPRARCRECIRQGRQAPGLFCTCDEPEPRAVVLFGAIPVPDAVECGRCGRPVM